MSDTDSFIREVTEEVRQDRMLRYWKRYGPYVLGGIAVILAVAAAFSWLDQREREAALERGAALIAAREAGADEVAALAGEVDGEAAVLAELRLAQALAAEGERDRAAETYLAVAGNASLPERYRALAELEALRLTALARAPGEVLAALGELAQPDAPFRPLALELRAAVLLNSGDVEGARSDLETAMADPAASGETRARAQALLATLPPTE